MASHCLLLTNLNNDTNEDYFAALLMPISRAKIKAFDSLTQLLTVDCPDSDINAVLNILRFAGHLNANAYVRQKIKYPRLIMALSFLLLLALLYIFFAPILLLPLPQMINPHFSRDGFIVSRILMSVAVMLINYQYFNNSFRKTAASFNNNILTCISIVLLLCFGIYTYLPDSVNAPIYTFWYETAAFITVLAASSENYFYLQLQHLTAFADKKYLLPENACVLDLDSGKEETVPAAKLQIDDIIIIKDNQRLPIDGVISSGCGLVDEKILTGEAEAVQKKEGDFVFAGTVNEHGIFQYRVSAVQNNSVARALSRFQKLAVQTSAEIERTAAKISSAFLIFTVVAAVFVFAACVYMQCSGSFILALTVSVLLIGGFASFQDWLHFFVLKINKKTADYGVFFKTAEVIEQSRHIDTVIFGKTGILTKGVPVVAGLDAEGIGIGRAHV